MTRETFAMSVAAYLVSIKSIDSIVENFFGANSSTFVWACFGSATAVAMSKEVSHFQGIVRTIGGSFFGTIGSPVIIHLLSLQTDIWSHRLIAAMAGFFTILLLPLIIESVPSIFSTAVETVKSWITKKGS